MKKSILVLGAGLSGLLTAKRLNDQGYEVKVLESRNRCGGRIHTKQGSLSTAVEMGATWFGKKHIHLLALLDELGIGYYEQHTEGKAFFEPFSLAPPQSIDIPAQLPSYRIKGGSESVITNLASSLNAEQIVLDTKIDSIDFSQEKVTVHCNEKKWTGDIVISTLPPALLFLSIKINPTVNQELNQIGLATHTWMQDAIKTALIFENPFWRKENGSGTLFSNVGPVSEFYDHSDHKVEKFALCGFVNSGLASLDVEKRKAKVLTQLEKFYGKIVHSYVEYVEHIWPQDSNTKHVAMPYIFPHQNNGHPIYQKAWFDDRFFVSGSETALDFPGYMDGAVQSAELVANKIINATIAS